MTVPTITVLMPMRNEQGNVDAALDSLWAQSYPRDALEVLVFDGRSTDRTVGEVIAWSQRHPALNLRCYDNPDRLQAAAFNAGLRRCTGDLVFLMSSTHGDIDPDYIATMQDVLAEDPDVWAVGGHCEAYGRTDWGDAVARAIKSPVGLGAPAWRRGGGRPRDVDHVGYGLYRRSAFERVGGFAEDLVINEDYELTWRMRSAGGRVRLQPSVRARYLTRDTPRLLARQYLTYGVHKARMLRRHPRSARPRQLVPAATTVTAAALALAFPWSAKARRVAALLAASYGAVTSLAAWSAGGDEPAKAPRIAAAMAVMHFCYGGGNVVGALWPVPRSGSWRPTDDAEVLTDSAEPSECDSRLLWASPGRVPTRR